MVKSWKKRLNIAIDTGSKSLVFMSKDNRVLAGGYNRVVIGKRGPYVEFTTEQIQWDSFYVPAIEIYRWHDVRAFYVEFRSKCEANVMLYYQKRTVAYADYKIGMCYIAPSDLIMLSTCPVLSS